jgi:hypothetical protein
MSFDITLLACLAALLVVGLISLSLERLQTRRRDLHPPGLSR